MVMADETNGTATATADDGLVEVTLRRTVRQRSPGGGMSRSYGPGTVRVPRDLARSLGINNNTPDALRARERAGLATGVPEGTERPEGAGPAPKNAAGKPANARSGAEAGEGGTEQVNDAYTGMSRDDLVAEAERRPNVKVTRADGKPGDPLVSDYQAALRADDASRK